MSFLLKVVILSTMIPLLVQAQDELPVETKEIWGLMRGDVSRLSSLISNHGADKIRNWLQETNVKLSGKFYRFAPLQSPPSSCNMSEIEIACGEATLDGDLLESEISVLDFILDINDVPTENLRTLISQAYSNRQEGVAAGGFFEDWSALIRSVVLSGSTETLNNVVDWLGIDDETLGRMTENLLGKSAPNAHSDMLRRLAQLHPEELNGSAISRLLAPPQHINHHSSMESAFRVLVEEGECLTNISNGVTLHHCVAGVGSVSMMELLLEKTVGNLPGEDDPEDSAYFSDLFTLESLINRQDLSGDTTLHRAIHGRNSEMITFLIGRGANPNAFINCLRRSALHLAILGNDLESVRVLLEGRANVDQVDSNGNAAIHYAAYNGFLEILKLLHSHRASFLLRNKLGQTANDIVSQRLERFVNRTEYRIRDSFYTDMVVVGGNPDLAAQECTASESYVSSLAQTGDAQMINDLEAVQSFISREREDQMASAEVEPGSYDRQTEEQCCNTQAQSR